LNQRPPVICFVPIVVLFLSSLLSCQKEQTVEEAGTEISPEIAQLIREIPAGLVSPDEEIEIQFLVPFDPSGIDEKTLSFSPPIKGELISSNSYSLTFKPAETLPFRQTYRASLSLDHLFPEESQLPDTFAFDFETAGRELTSFEGDFRLISPDMPENVFYQGSVVFSEPVALNIVEKAITMKEGTGKLALKWTEDNGGKAFTFTTDQLLRGEQRRHFRLSADQGSLELSEAFSREITLEAVAAFSLDQIVPRTDGINPGFTLVFSDELDPAQDIRGLIRVEPHVEITVSTAGKSVLISGNFSFGTSYTLIVSRGVRSRWGTKTEEETKRSVEFDDIKPQMVFLHDGVFLPSTGKGKIYFRTVNLRRVRLEVKQVFENNLGQFLQTERLASKRDRNEQFNDRYVGRVGIPVAEEILEIGEEKNIWLNHELNLSSLLRPDEKGPYLISLKFERDDMIYNLSQDRRSSGGGDFYSDPNSWGYLWAHGRIYKPLVISDVGITWKSAAGEHRVFTSDLMNAKQLEGAMVELRSYQNQILASGLTDKDGQVRFEGVDGEVFYVTAEKEGLRSIIKANEMAWNLSSFETEGVEVGPEGTRAFLFTERGVYRPGDSIYLSAIIRNQDGTFPEHHPISLKLTNPRGQIVHEEVNTNGVDGFYQFRLHTADDDPTGAWQAEILAGSSRFVKDIRVETIVPFRLKVNLSPEKRRLDFTDRKLSCRIESKYLFGAPAAGLEATLQYRLAHRAIQFPAFPAFSFTNEAITFQELAKVVFEGRLDSRGTATVQFNLPPFHGAPSALDLVLTGGAAEKGGREVTRTETLPVDPYPYYVGLRRPEMEYGYLQLGTEHTISTVVVDRSGRAVPGRTLSYSVYRNNRYWWWEYDTYDDFHLRYKSDAHTEKIGGGTIVSESAPVGFQIKPESWGEYLVEVEDASGHKAAFFFRASMWGQSAGGEDAGLLTLKSDRELYHPGEEAVVSLPSMENGNLLVTVEKANQILSAEWHAPAARQTELRIPITKAMLPNAYVTVSYLQPYDQNTNDRPIRMYGIIPLAVEEASTHQEIDITTEEVLLPGEQFTVALQTRDRQPTQFTLAVVDEGLLDLTAFRTPDPWKSFYGKQRLAVYSYDLFSQIIGAHKGDVFRTFAIGGGEGLLMVDEEKARRQKRFEPVVMITEPAMTGAGGHAEVRFTMPNYMGSVRLMAVTASGPRYGTSETTVPVRSDLVMLPSLPRVLGPEEQIDVVVSLFAMSDSIETADVSLETGGPVSVVGASSKTISFTGEAREQDVYFKIKTHPAVGKARIVFNARSGRSAATSTTSLEVRASSPPLYRSEQKSAASGETVSFVIPDDGMPGTNQARIVISPWGNLNLEQRLAWLIRYPWGCIEQTTSAVFPQLYLKSIVLLDRGEAAEIDENINAGISLLRKFQLPSGGFSYWPGSESLSAWGTNYAGHFFLEAERLGYPVPEDMKERWIQFQHSRALSYQDSLLTQVLRLYLLALAGRPAVGPMNFIVENNLSNLSNTERWVLAAAYGLAGIPQTSERILAEAGTGVQSYEEYAGTYGSTLRDQALILEMSRQLKSNRVAESMYEVVAGKISTKDWYSTQSLGYSLLAISKYLSLGDSREPSRIIGKIGLPGGGEIPFFIEQEVLSHDLEEGFGDRISVTIDPETGARRSFVRLEWQGIPLRAEVEPESKQLSLDVRWFDEKGTAVDPRDLEQGTELWGHFRVGRTTASPANMEELALVQILPSGWEIENIRLSGEPVPSWSKDFTLGDEEYTDYRDDRVAWFFDLPRGRRYLDFLVKVRAVTPGSFFLPPAVCEAMYRQDTRAVQPGGPVTVRSSF
jgi:uncharacterized protein YfaS (alpha-2-macroglobulin family)